MNTIMWLTMVMSWRHSDDVADDEEHDCMLSVPNSMPMSSLYIYLYVYLLTNTTSWLLLLPLLLLLLPLLQLLQLPLQPIRVQLLLHKL